MTDQFVDDPHENALQAITLVDSHCAGCGDFHLASLVRRAALPVKARVGDQAIFIAALQDQLAEISRGLNRPVQITIAGSTDTWLYTAILNAALRVGGKRMAEQISVDLVDQCQTPLVLCRAFAEKAGLEIQIHHSDIKDHTPPNAVDLVVMHGVLPFFPENEQINYLKRIGSWLSERGKIICSNQHGKARGSEELEDRIDFTIDSLGRLLNELPDSDNQRRTDLERRVRTALQTRHKFKMVFSHETEAQDRLREAGLRLDDFKVYGNRTGNTQATRYAERAIFTCSRLF